MCRLHILPARGNLVIRNAARQQHLAVAVGHIVIPTVGQLDRLASAGFVVIQPQRRLAESVRRFCQDR